MDLYQFKSLKRYPQCDHIVTTKVDSEPYAMSLALHTGEQCSTIVANRQKIGAIFGKGAGFSFVTANQTHSNHISVIGKKETKGWFSLEDAVADCDGLISNVKGVMLTILTADCVPLLMYDCKAEVVAAVHAGWKGTQGKIAVKAVKKMQELFGCDPANIVVGIAPAIGVCCYEVGVEVAEHFFETPKAVKRTGEKYKLNLPLINRLQLLDAGVKAEHIEMSGICTACEVDRFFSYRKEQGCSGRFMSMIGLK